MGLGLLAGLQCSYTTCLHDGRGCSGGEGSRREGGSFPAVLPVLRAGFPGNLLFLPTEVVRIGGREVATDLGGLSRLTRTVNLSLRTQFPRVGPANRAPRIEPAVTLYDLASRLPWRNCRFPTSSEDRLLEDASLLLAADAEEAKSEKYEATDVLVSIGRSMVIADRSGELEYLLLSRAGRRLPELPSTRNRPDRVAIAKCSMGRVGVILVRRVRNVGRRNGVHEILTENGKMLLGKGRNVLPGLDLPYKRVKLNPVDVGALSDGRTARIILSDDRRLSSTVVESVLDVRRWYGLAFLGRGLPFGIRRTASYPRKC